MRTPVKDTKSIDVQIHHDVVNEQVVIASVLVDTDTRKKLIRIPIDTFQSGIHQTLWHTLQEMDRKNLAFDLATIQSMAPNIDIEYLNQLIEARPDVPPNLNYHVKTLHWDKARHDVATGPLASFVSSIKDPKAEPEKTKTLAKAIYSVLEGYRDETHMRDSEALIGSTMDGLQTRMKGISRFTYGIESLDNFEDGTPRMIPGARPKQITVLTGLSGSGKTTLVAQMVLGIARSYDSIYRATGIKKTVLFGAWETESEPMLELMACMALGLSRTDLVMGRITDQQFVSIQDKSRRICEYVKFMDCPFQRKRGERKRTNDMNLDLIQDCIESTGADLFVADLLQRAFVEKKPDEEETALFRMQALIKESNCHAILCHQQRGKDVEQRQDKKPTREALKGAGAWVEIADTILGTHRPALWRPVPDTTLEIAVLKQRWGKWPISVEFDFNPEYGVVSNGRSIAYNVVEDVNAAKDGPVDDFLGGNKKRNAMTNPNPQQNKKSWKK